MIRHHGNKRRARKRLRTARQRSGAAVCVCVSTQSMPHDLDGSQHPKKFSPSAFMLFSKQKKRSSQKKKDRVREARKSLSFSLSSFITPTLIYRFYLQLSLYRFIIQNRSPLSRLQLTRQTAFMMTFFAFYSSILTVKHRLYPTTYRNPVTFVSFTLLVYLILRGQWG